MYRLRTPISRAFDNTVLTSSFVIEHRELTEQDRATYYSSWIYAAIHVASTIPKLQSKLKICEFLNIPMKKILPVFEFLSEKNLIQMEGDRVTSGASHIHLGADAQIIRQHHSNFRFQAIDSLDREQESDLHYSAVVSLSQEDAAKIKDIILEQLKSNLGLIRESKEENLFCLNLDFFNMQKGL